MLDGIPQANRLIAAGRKQPLSVRAELDGDDGIFMAGKRRQPAAAGSIPQADYPVIPSTGQDCALGIPGDGTHLTEMIVQRHEQAS